LTGQRLSTQAVYIMLKKQADQAGAKEYSPHDFRRTFVVEMLDAGADTATAAELASHASVTTTVRYDRPTEETRRKAASLLHFPF
jgi:site-specific recombinase XerD